MLSRQIQGHCRRQNNSRNYRLHFFHCFRDICRMHIQPDAKSMCPAGKLTIPGKKQYRHHASKDKIRKSSRSNYWCKSICNRQVNTWHRCTWPGIPPKTTATQKTPPDRKTIPTSESHAEQGYDKANGLADSIPDTPTYSAKFRCICRGEGETWRIWQNENRVVDIYNAVSVRSEAKLTIRWLYDIYDILPCWIVEYKYYCKVKIHWKIGLFIPVRPYLRPRILNLSISPRLAFCSSF